MTTTRTSTASQRPVWDLPTRVFHWALAASFAGAYLLAEVDRARGLHVMFGYTVLGLVAFRIVWGFAGSPASRFANFAYGPLAALRYLRDLAAGRARDHAGHNPAGSWAIYMMLALALATATTGWLTLNGVGGEEAFEDVHESLANAWLALVVLHVVAIAISSLLHRRNLAVSMITGRVPAATTLTADRPHWTLGSLLVALVVGFWTWSASGGSQALIAGAAVEAEQDTPRHADRHGEHDDD